MTLKHDIRPIIIHVLKPAKLAEHMYYYDSSDCVASIYFMHLLHIQLKHGEL